MCTIGLSINSNAVSCISAQALLFGFISGIWNSFLNLSYRNVAVPLLLPCFCNRVPLHLLYFLIGVYTV